MSLCLSVLERQPGLSTFGKSYIYLNELSSKVRILHINFHSIPIGTGFQNFQILDRARHIF